MKKNLEDLSLLIKTEIEHEIRMDRELMDFLDSYYNIKSIEDFKSSIEKDEIEDLEVFFEMVFSPDLKFQESIESIIETACLNEEDENQVASILINNICRGTLRFSDLSEIVIDIDKYLIEIYLKKLNLKKKLPVKIIEIINSGLYEDFKSQAKVLLRNSRVVFSDSVIEFFRKIIQIFGYDTENIDYIFKFCIKTAEENRKDLDYKKLLVSKKNKLIEQLSMIEKMELSIEKLSIESLMMKGARFPAQSKNSIENTIRIIDRLLFCL